MAGSGRYLVMRLAPRPGWQGKYPTISTRRRSLADALDTARELRRRYEQRVWLAAVGAPATLPRAARGKP